MHERFILSLAEDLNNLNVGLCWVSLEHSIFYQYINDMAYIDDAYTLRGTHQAWMSSTASGFGFVKILYSTSICQSVFYFGNITDIDDCNIWREIIMQKWFLLPHGRHLRKLNIELCLTTISHSVFYLKDMTNMKEELRGHCHACLLPLAEDLNRFNIGLHPLIAKNSVIRFTFM